MAQQPPKVLTVAGSDSGGAAGLQADLKTFTALGVYGMSVVTAVTAQNSARVEGVYPLPASFVAQQLDAVLDDYGAAAVKTGFIGSPELVRTIAARLAIYKERRSFPLIVDPVLVDHRGNAMFGAEVVEAYKEQLLPLADLVTPNRAEAALLWGQPVKEPEEMEAAAEALHRLGAAHLLLKGGRRGEQLVDLFYDGQTLVELPSPAVETTNTHGSGDTLSAAIAAFLALASAAGATASMQPALTMRDAVVAAQRLTHAAIAAAAGWQMGAGHGPLNHLYLTDAWRSEGHNVDPPD